MGAESFCLPQFSGRFRAMPIASTRLQIRCALTFVVDFNRSCFLLSFAFSPHFALLLRACVTSVPNFCRGFSFQRSWLVKMLEN